MRIWCQLFKNLQISHLFHVFLILFIIFTGSNVHLASATQQQAFTAKVLQNLPSLVIHCIVCIIVHLHLVLTR